jgi:CPA1 family monovalent cation:H+ antiporter
VLIGLALGFLSEQNINISPQLILALLAPPLVFDAAFHIRLEDLRRDFWLILLLAVPSMILTTLMVGWLVAQGAGLAIPIAMVFGALVSAAAPVAVVALFRRLGAPHRLQVLLEGENLFNDEPAIVKFTLTVTIVLRGQFSLAGNIANFLAVAGGGLLVRITLHNSILSPGRARLEGKNPFEWPVTILYKGLKVVRGLEETEVIFPNGKAVKVSEEEACVVSM